MKEQAAKSTTNNGSHAFRANNAHQPFFNAGGSFFNPEVMQKKETPFFSETPSRPFFNPIQRQEISEEEESLQGKFKTIQRQGSPEEDELLQGKFEPQQQQENKTALPDQLKTGIEHLSGYSMDDVKVHYNSPNPPQLQAHAYAQGTNIHVASGQEKHLPHEAWHVVQQKQGRVKPTMQLKGKVKVNDDVGLEKEADVMGGKAAQLKPNPWNNMITRSVGLKSLFNSQRNPIQRNESESGDSISKGEEKKNSDKVKTVASVFLKGTVFMPGEGAIAAISKSTSGTGGHAWAAYEYLSSIGEKKGAVMHLTAKGGKGDSASGGSGGSGHHSGSGESIDSGEGSGSHGLGELTGSKLKKAGAVGSFQSAVVSNEQDSGAMSYSKSSNTNVGSAEPETFKGSITININDKPDSSYLTNMAKKPNKPYKIKESNANAALAKSVAMKSLAAKHKYVYAITGRSISLTKTGMNCARFAEKILKAAGVNASAGWIIKTPRELGIGKKFFH